MKIKTRRNLKYTWTKDWYQALLCSYSIYEPFFVNLLHIFTRNACVTVDFARQTKLSMQEILRANQCQPLPSLSFPLLQTFPLTLLYILSFPVTFHSDTLSSIVQVLKCQSPTNTKPMAQLLFNPICATFLFADIKNALSYLHHCTTNDAHAPHTKQPGHLTCTVQNTQKQHIHG